MMTSNPNNQSFVSRQSALQKPIHRGACGDWYEVVRDENLPTEHISSANQSIHGRFFVVREVKTGELLGREVVGLVHANLVETKDAKRTTDSSGRQLLVQNVDFDPQSAASKVPQVELMTQGKNIVSAVACALSHLHALGLGHGAVRLDNVFFDKKTWRLGPSLCDRRITPAKDMLALSSLIGVELSHLVIDSTDHAYLLRLSKLCATQQVGAAHIAIWTQIGAPDKIRFSSIQPLLAAPRTQQTASGIRLSTQDASARLAMCCRLNHAPKPGSLIPFSQLDQMGNVYQISLQNDVVIPLPSESSVVFCLSLSNELAVVGSHTLIDSSCDWDWNLDLKIHQGSIILRWFWPKDILCQTIFIQARPDRFPCASDKGVVYECKRATYEAYGHCGIPFPKNWHRIFVRVYRSDASCQNVNAGVYGLMERNKPLTGLSRWSSFIPRLVRKSNSCV